MSLDASCLSSLSLSFSFPVFLCPCVLFVLSVERPSSFCSLRSCTGFTVDEYHRVFHWIPHIASTIPFSYRLRISSTDFPQYSEYLEEHPLLTSWSVFQSSPECVFQKEEEARTSAVFLSALTSIPTVTPAPLLDSTVRHL